MKKLLTVFEEILDRKFAEKLEEVLDRKLEGHVDINRRIKEVYDMNNRVLKIGCMR